MSEPRRLFTRYLIEPWYILLLLLLDYPRTQLWPKLRARVVTGYSEGSEHSGPLHMRGDS
jgi:hypothetical protein